MIHRHNELRDLEADMLNMVCHDVQVEPVLQEITVEILARSEESPRCSARCSRAWLFERGKALPFFNVRVCHANVEPYKDLTIKPINSQHENERKQR